MDKQAESSSWIGAEKPDLAPKLTPSVCKILSQVASESRDESQHVYTQAEMVRAIELARGAA